VHPCPTVAPGGPPVLALASQVARDRSCIERFTGLLLGLGLAALIAAVLIVVAVVDSTGTLAPWQAALGAVLCVLSVVLVPCVYRPSLPKQGSAPRATPVPVIGATTKGQTLPYRSTRVDSLVVNKKYPGGGVATTLREMWDLTCREHGRERSVGWRKVLDRYVTTKTTHPEGGAPVTKKFRRIVLDNEFSFLTYNEANERVCALSRGINAIMDKHCGTAADSAAAASASAGSSKPRHAAIFAASRVDWHLSAQACFRAAVPLATVYNTLGKDGLAYAVNLTEATVLFVEGATLGVVSSVATSGALVGAGEEGECRMDLSCVKTVVLLDDVSSPDVDAAAVEALRSRPDEHGGPLEVLTIDQLKELGEEERAEPPAPGPDDTAVIMFTSGSTGLPKGVVVLHRNLVACAAGLGGSLPNICSNDVWLAYLPSSHVSRRVPARASVAILSSILGSWAARLIERPGRPRRAHGSPSRPGRHSAPRASPRPQILELAAELCFVSVGGALGYGSPFTLTAASPSIPQPGDTDASGAAREADVLGDTLALKPTVMACVPAVVARIRKGVMGTIKKATGIRRWLADYSLRTATAAFNAGTGTPFLDGLVFDALRKRVLGGKVRMIASGGGPLSADAQVWMNVVMRCPMRQGYGLTETCGGGTLQWVDDRTTVRVGPPILSNDIKLMDWEEGGYFTSDRPPRGEVCICGHNVTAGYYKEPEKTAEAFVEEEGRVWFRTGDVGQFDDDGVLRIIDRKKDLVKLERGEYISLGKMESVFSNVDGIANIVCYGRSTEPDSVAVVIVDEAALPDELKRPSEAAYVGDKEVGDYIHGLIQAKARDAKFANKGEIPSRVYIGGSTMWLPPSGLVTASMKIQRKKVDRYYEGAYAFMYRSGSDPRAELAAIVPAQV